LEIGKNRRLDLQNMREEILQYGLKLFDIFSNLDALKIFLYAQNGIENSKRVMKELELTPKRYYTRLKELMEIGVLERGGKGYRYTPFGEALYQLGYYLYNVLEHKEKLKLIGDLRDSKILEPHEMERVLEIFSEDSEGLELVLKSLGMIDETENIEKIDNFDKLAERLAEDIKFAEDYIYLASRYLDMRVIEACMKAMKRKVEVKVLLSEEHLSNKLNKLRFLLTPILLKMAIEIISSFKIQNFLRKRKISYSFCIIDEKICLFEFPPFMEGNFSIAFRVVDKYIAEKFKEYFEELWNKTETKIILDIGLERQDADQYSYLK